MKLTPKQRKARKKPGGSNVGKYKRVKSSDFCGPAGGAPAGSFPVNTLKRAKSALKLAQKVRWLHENPETKLNDLDHPAGPDGVLLLLGVVLVTMKRSLARSPCAGKAERLMYVIHVAPGIRHRGLAVPQNLVRHAERVQSFFP